MTLKDFCEIKTNFPDANFWLESMGTDSTIGVVSKEFKPERIGIKVTRLDLLLPEYLFYVLQYFHSIGYFKTISTTLKASKVIKVSDIQNIKLG